MKNSIIIFLFVICSLLSGICEAQSLFQLRIGGTSSDYARSIIRTADGGYAVAGATRSFGAGYEDMYIVKLDASGTLQWSKTVGGTSYDDAYSIIQTTDGGYAVAGYTQSFGAGSTDMYIVKLDAGGTLQWTTTVGSTEIDFAYSIVQTTDGGYAVAGETYSFGVGGYVMYIVKLDGSGTLQWSRTIYGRGGDYAYSIIQTADGGYAVAGLTLSFGVADMYIVKLDAAGSLQWSKTVGGTSYDDAYSIIQTTDGGYAVAGYTLSFGAGNYDMYIVKLDGSGTLQWSRTIGGTGLDFAYSIIQTTDGGYAAAGLTLSFGVADMYIVKLDGSGNLQWSRIIGETGSDYARSIVQTTDGGYAVAGGAPCFSTDMYIVKLNSNGKTCGISSTPPSNSGSGGTLGSPTSIVNSLKSTVTTPAPSVSSGGTVKDPCLTGPCLVGIQPISNELPNSYQLYQNYPNPFNPSTVISFQLAVNSFTSLKVYDVLGREVAALVNENLKVGTYEVDFDGSGFASGVYFYKLSASDGAGEFTDVKKMILVK